MTVSLAAHQKFNLGVYDPQQAFADADNIGIDHIFISWIDNESARIRKTFDEAKQKNRWLMITVEPWPRDRQNGGATLLTDILSHEYDNEIYNFCTAIAGLGAPVLVRWGHEMDARADRYPWANGQGESYIGAYKHFVDVCRSRTDQAYYIWSPAGEAGLARYYPGRSYVDTIGLSVYSFAYREIDQLGRVRPFTENFGEKYERVYKYGAPVMIAEFGVDGDAAHQRRWIAAGLSSLRRYPLLESIVYFNAKDHPDAWETQYGIPDWTINPQNLLTKPR